MHNPLVTWTVPTTDNILTFLSSVHYTILPRDTYTRPSPSRVRRYYSGIQLGPRTSFDNSNSLSPSHLSPRPKPSDHVSLVGISTTYPLFPSRRFFFTGRPSTSTPSFRSEALRRNFLLPQHIDNFNTLVYGKESLIHLSIRLTIFCLLLKFYYKRWWWSSLTR